MFLLFFFLAKQECWADSIRTCKENDIFSAHTPPAASKDQIGPHFFFLPTIALPLFLFFLSHPITLSLQSAQCKPHSHFIPSPVAHMHTHPLPHPQLSPQGAIVTQWEGSITIAWLLSATTPPHPLPASPPITSVRSNHPIAVSPTPAGRPQLSANGIRRFLRRSGGCKAAQQQWGAKKERS